MGPPRVSLHRVTGGSGASEVRVSRAGLWLPRVTGIQASQIPSRPELGGRTEVGVKSKRLGQRSEGGWSKDSERRVNGWGCHG